MANHKRKKRRRGGVRGCCGMCMLQRYRDCFHRVPTRQEMRAKAQERDE